MLDRLKDEVYNADVVLCSHLAPWYPGAHAQLISPNQGIKEHSPLLRQYPDMGHWLLSPGNLGNMIRLTGFFLKLLVVVVLVVASEVVDFVVVVVVVVVVVEDFMLTLVLFWSSPREFLATQE